MTPANISRRHILSAAAAGAFSSSLGLRPKPVNAAEPQDAKLTVVRRSIEVNGKPASVFGIRDAAGAPGVTLAPGQRFKLNLTNEAGEKTIVHWHGQTPPPDQDGVVETGYASLIAPGARQGYDFVARPGTFWMHSHHGLQEQRLMAAPLIIHSAADLRADMQEVVVMLHDFTFRDPAAVLADLTGTKAMPGMAQQAAADGHEGGALAGMNMAGMAMPGMAMDRGAPRQSGGAAPTMDLNDVDYDAYLANDRTLSDPLVVRTERSGRVRLRLINGATSTAFWIDLGSLRGSVVAVDGDPVHPVMGRRFPLAQAQRLDIVLSLPRSGGAFPILAQREGDRQRTGIILATPGASVARIADLAERAAPGVDLSLEQRLSALSPLPVRKAAITHDVVLSGSMQPYAWAIDGRTWADHRPIRVAKGQRVILRMINRSMMAHPMHLHGHHFQVIALNGRALSGAMRDTVLVPASGTVAVAFDADNPGRWLLHCHNLFHMATGMMTEVAYDTAT